MMLNIDKLTCNLIHVNGIITLSFNGIQTDNLNKYPTNSKVNNLVLYLSVQ